MKKKKRKKDKGQELRRNLIGHNNVSGYRDTDNQSFFFSTCTHDTSAVEIKKKSLQMRHIANIVVAYIDISAHILVA